MRIRGFILRRKLASPGGNTAQFWPYLRCMNRLVRIAVLASIALSILARPTRAAYDDVGVSARVTGLGNAFTAVADDVYSVYYNPAGLATLDRKEFGSTYTKLLTGLSDGSNIQNSFLAYAHPIDDGRLGTIGAGFNYFTLDSLYRESSVFGSYGRQMTREDRPDPIFAGITAKYLNRTLGGTSVASNALSNTGQATGFADPGLQSTSHSNFDADLGLLWRARPNWNLGLQVQHLMEPNIAFSPDNSDKLGRNIKLGGAYRTPFTTLSTDGGFLAAPDGSLDKRISVAAEKWLPTLLYGAFGVRTGIGFGSRDYRQLSTGISYRVHRMQVDYGIAIPMGGLNRTGGTHRVGLTWRFGATPQADQLLGDMLLENLTSIAPVGSAEFNKQASELVAYKRKAIDSLMRDADAEAQLGRMSRAQERSRQAASLAPKDAILAELDERYRTSAAYFQDLSRVLHQSTGAVTHDGVMKYIAGKDREALASLNNAKSMEFSLALEGLIRVLEAKVASLPAPVVPEPTAPVATSTAVAANATVAVSTPTAASAEEARKRILESNAALMEVAFFQQEWDKVAKLAEQIIALDPGNIAAYKRLGAANHAMNKHADALRALKGAYALESDEGERVKLRSYIAAIKALIDKQSRPAVTRKSGRPAGGPENIEKLYEAGVELYSQGRLIEAREAFRRCLQIDENYVPAQRAYQRVQAEMSQTGKEH